MQKKTAIFYVFIAVEIFAQHILAETSTQNRMSGQIKTSSKNEPTQQKKRIPAPVQMQRKQPSATNQVAWQIAGDKSAVFFRGINTWTKAKVTGVFSNIQGQVTYDKTDMQTSKVHLRIPVKSLKTQKADVKHKRFKQVSDENLANHMLSEPFFGLYRKKGREKIINPQGQYIKFTSTSVEALGGDLEQQQLNICGTLIIRGKRKANQCFKGRLENTTLKGSPAKRFVGRTTINRKDFGVGKGWMTFTIGNNVDIQMNILLRGQGSVASQQQTLRPQSSS